MKAINLYVAFVGALAVVALALFDWTGLLFLSGSHWIGLISLVIIGLISESLALTIEVEGNAGGVSITFIPLLTAVLLFGPGAGVFFVLVAGGIGESLLREKPPIRVVFNVAQWVVATVAAGWMFAWADGDAIMSVVDGSADVSISRHLAPFIAYSLVFLVFNHGAVSFAISLSERVAFVDVWKTLVGTSGGNIFYDLLISPIAIAVALFYVALGLVGLLVALLPLLFIRRSYLTNLKLQEANRDLLAALVKAIETRDPYTSGHSVRVSELAARIAREMGLSSSSIDAVETASLLHDIGKIDAGYSEILQKSDSLSPEERRVIESHVTKGVELLKSLSSFGKDVIGAVRHHHERIDGKGYPDGLVGKEIPLGARIIRVCDAIDAMLSDRPYRDALSLPAVREQLRTYSGIQFDPEVVRHVIDSDLLWLHSEAVQTSKEERGEKKRGTRAPQGRVTRAAFKEVSLGGR